MLLTDLLTEELNLHYHKTLNPKLWDGDLLKVEVRNHLLKISDEFCKKLEIPKNKINDVVFTGSNTNYNWSSSSDIDLHIIVNYTNDEKCDNISLDNCFKAQKDLWNDKHDITIKGIDVELYVQLKDEQMSENAGVYSVMHNEWIVEPAKKDVKYDKKEIETKAKPIMRDIDRLEQLKVFDASKSDTIKKKIKSMRKVGLNRGGEFSLENLVFKYLRYNGYLEKLSNYHKQAVDQKLSLK